MKPKASGEKATPFRLVRDAARCDERPAISQECIFERFAVAPDLRKIGDGAEHSLVVGLRSRRSVLIGVCRRDYAICVFVRVRVEQNGVNKAEDC
jgi:hypothetical protein